MAERTLEIKISARNLYDKELQRAEGRFKAASESIRQNFVANFARAAGAAIAFKKAFDFAEEAAKFDQQQQAFANLAASHGQNAQSMISGLKAMSGQTLSTAAIMESAGKAMVLGIPAEQLSEMMEIARASARITGDSVQKSFEDIALGVGRGSKMILDNLGIIVNTDEAYKEYARTLGITVDKLTEAQKKQAFTNATMKAGQDIIRRVGAQGITASEAMAMFTARLQDLRIMAGKAIIAITSALTGVAFEISKVFAQVLKTAATALANIYEFAGRIPIVGDAYKEAAQSVRSFAEMQGGAVLEADKLANKSFEVAAAIFKEKEAIEGLNQQRQAETPASPEDDPIVQTIKTRMQYRDSEISQLYTIADVMAFNAERMMATSEMMAAKIAVDNQRIAWSNQARANLAAKANSAMSDSMLELIETGRFSVGAFAQIMAQQTKIELAGMAAKAGVKALFYTAEGFAALAGFMPQSAASYFTAAGQMALISGASLAAGAAVNAIAGGKATRPEAGTPGGEPVRTQDVGTPELLAESSMAEKGQIVTKQEVTISGIITPETIDRLIEDEFLPGFDRAAAKNLKISGEAVAA